MRYVFSAIFIAVLVLPALAQTDQTDPISEILDSNPQAWWGVILIEAATGDVRFERNADRSFMPASVTKIFTTAAALDQLGPDYRYETRLYLDGGISNSVLTGDLIIRGSGDPSVGTPGRDHLALFSAWADSLEVLGVREIHGNIIGDDDVFDDQGLGADWSWDDAIYGYAAPAGGLTFHENVVDISIHGTSSGAPGSITWVPAAEGILEFSNETVTVPAGGKMRLSFSRSIYDRSLSIEGQVPMGRSDRESISVTDPTTFFVEVFRQYLGARGIVTTGTAVDLDGLPLEPVYDSLSILARHYSAPLSEIAAVTNKDSHNLYAEHLLRTLGVENPVPGSRFEPGSADMGRQAASRTFAAAGVDTIGLQLVDGSGLSRRNLVSPRMTAAVLRYMSTHEDPEIRQAFDASLAIGGIDGTLEFRFPRGASGHKVVRAKTGTIGNVSSLAGFVKAGSGTDYVFVLFCNHFIAPYRAIRGLQDRVVNHVARNY